MKAGDYVGIRVWGKQLGSFDYYIKGEQAKAVEMKAPADALYERDGKWVCVSDLTPDHPFRVSYAQALGERKG